MDLTPVQRFDPKGEPTSVSTRWSRWKRSFELYVAARGDTPDAQKRALLLHCAGLEVQDIFDTLPDTTDTYNSAVAALDKYFKPQQNYTFERHLFRQISQQKDETTSQFVTRLRRQAANCNFGDTEEENIADQVVDKCVDLKLKAKYLERGTLKLQIILDMARSHEAAIQQVRSMALGHDDTHSSSTIGAVSKVKSSPGAVSKDKRALNYSFSRGNPGRQQMKYENKDKNIQNHCFRCGRSGHYSKDVNCPARGKVCSKCSKPNHFAAVCKSGMSKRNVRSTGHAKSLNFVTQTDEDVQWNDNDDYVFSLPKENNEYVLSVPFSGKNADFIDIFVGNVCIPVMVDSGASVNIVDKETWNDLKKRHIKCISNERNTTDRKLYPYGSREPLKVMGTFTTKVSLGGNQGKCIDAEFVVIDGKGISLLGKESSQKLGILQIGLPPVFVGSVCEKPEKKDCYKVLHQGLGKLKGQKIKLHLKDNVKPVVQSVRKVPFSLRPKVEEKITELLALDIIERAEGPTSFVSPIVVVPKPNGKDIRLCVDMRQANEAVERERFPIPTVEEVLLEINGSKVFSKLDLNMGYHQLELEESSRSITTFTTHLGLFRYKRLMFGITSAPEIYQNTIQNILHDCQGARNISDDIIVYADTVEEHDKRLEKVLETLKENGLTLNKEKCSYRMTELQFMGFLLSERGIGPTSAKVDAVKKAEAPKSASEVRSFLGLVNFNARFINDLATKSEPLRRLTRKGTPFKWGKEQEKAFSILKEELANTDTLAYFDTKAETRIIADASPVGLGAILLQKQKGENRVVYYASRSLSDVERRYSQTEKEALALIWACERFHQYIYGIDFILETDHKPLEFIYSKRSKPSARIERWMLRLQNYHFTIEYKPGSQNLADSLSRLMKQSDKVTYRTVADDYIYHIVKNAVPSALTLHEIESASSNDDELIKLKQCIMYDQWEECTNSTYKTLRYELSSVGNIILRGSRIIVPKTMRTRVIELAHEGHQGIVKTKERLRTKVWWPGIDKDAEKEIRSCHACQLVSQPAFSNPIVRTKFPDGPWQDLAIDLLGPLPTGESILVIVDYYSRYFETAILRSTQTKFIVRALEETFSRHGLPVSIKADNGPQFISEEFELYLKTNNIELRHTTPLWPQANGEVERQNRTLKKAMMIAQSEGKDWKQELNTFLLAYRSTPHHTTGVSPAELLFKRKIRTKLPELNTTNNLDEEIRDRDRLRKEKGKQYADATRHAKESEIKVGDEVLLKQKQTNKLTTPFESEPYKVVEKVDSSVTIQSPTGVKYKRNVAHTKPYIRKESTSTEIEEPPLNDNSAQLEQSECENEETTPKIRTSGRVRRQPENLKDYVLK